MMLNRVFSVATMGQRASRSGSRESMQGFVASGADRHGGWVDSLWEEKWHDLLNMCGMGQLYVAWD